MVGKNMLLSQQTCMIQNLVDWRISSQAPITDLLCLETEGSRAFQAPPPFVVHLLYSQRVQMHSTLKLIQICLELTTRWGFELAAASYKTNTYDRSENFQKLLRALLWALRVEARIMIVKLSQDRKHRDQHSLDMIIQARISCYHAMLLNNRVLLPFSASSRQIFQ